jgi:stage III sporulation protein AH
MFAISNMAACSMQEAQIENLLLAKNFEDCVVYIGAEKVTVAVPAPMEGLSEEAVARITEVICTETDYSPAQLSIIEVKA